VESRAAGRLVTHEQGLAALVAVIGAADGPVSVFVVDDHGELVAAVTMEGAAADTRSNAERKAYTAARSDQVATSALAAKVRDDPAELASFDPRFSFFAGGVAALANGRRVGAVGVSGLSGADDEALAVLGIRAAGLDPPAGW
jgi:glc operon protein GlcG